MFTNWKSNFLSVFIVIVYENNTFISNKFKLELKFCLFVLSNWEKDRRINVPGKKKCTCTIYLAANTLTLGLTDVVVPKSEIHVIAFAGLL